MPSCAHVYGILVAYLLKVRIARVNLEDYLDDLGWSYSELARQSGITRVTLTRIRKGLKVRPDIARRIADTLSEAFGTPILVRDIEDLHIERK